MDKSITFGNHPESSWIVSPQKRTKLANISEFTFTWIDILIVGISATTFLADIVTDMLLMLVYWKNNEAAWAGLTLAFFIVPAIILQIFSARWYASDGHKIGWVMVIVHLFLLGPIMRYVAVLRYGFKARKTKRIEDYQLMYSEMSDVSMLRLFECFLESAPQLVLQLHIMIRVEENDYILTGISACFSLLSLSWAIVAYTRALRAAATIHRRVSWTGAFLHGVWRGGMLLARLAAIVMFATVFQEWTLLFLGLHWLLMTIWIVYQDTDFCNTLWEERLFNLIIGIIYVFCFFNMKEGKSRYRSLFYYTIVLIENSVMILLWWPKRNVGKWYNIPALCSVWAGFAIGLLSMVLYYIFFHPASKRRCHCCMAWRILTFRCQSCSCHHHNNTAASPYKIVASDLRFFDSTDSSDESLDCRNFAELKISYSDQKHKQNKQTSSLQSREEIKQRAVVIDNRHKTENDADLVVVGNARTGFRVRQMLSEHGKVDVTSQKDETIAMPLPVATSTPGDDLKMEPLISNKIKDIALFTTPRKVIKPRSPNTLVKNWIRNTQEMYESNDACFLNSEKNCHDFAPALNKPDRRNPFRMKSFSKKDRLGSQSSFHQKSKKMRSGNLKNSFREVFGFRVVDLDKIDETSNCVEDSFVPQTAEQHCSVKAHVIRSRIDKPPSSALSKSNVGQIRSCLRQYPASSPRSRVIPVDAANRSSIQDKSVTSKQSRVSEECIEKENLYGLRVTDGNMKKSHSARKKLAFKDLKTSQTNSLSTFDKVVETKSASTANVLGSIENMC